MFDPGVQLRQAVIGHHGKHMMFDMIVHVPVNKPADPVHIYGAAVKSVIGHVVGQPAVLQQARHHMVPRPIQPGQPDHQQRQH